MNINSAFFDQATFTPTITYSYEISKKKKNNLREIYQVILG